MPKITFHPTKGLFIEPGSGVVINQAGLAGTKQGPSHALTGIAAADYNGSIDLPAGAVITEIGLTAKTAIKTANTSANEKLIFRAGTDADSSGIQFVAATDVLIRNTEAVAGATANTSAANKLVGAGTAIGIADAAVLYSATARTVYYRIRVNHAALTTKGTASVYIKYTIV